VERKTNNGTYVERNELQLNKSSCQSMDVLEDASTLAFEADIEALRQVISTFGDLKNPPC